MEINTALKHLVEVHPVFETAVEEFEAAFGNDVPLLSMGRVGSAFVQYFDEFDEDSRLALFTRVDALLVCGDDATETAVATGLLEAVISHIENRGHDRAPIERYFGPEADAYVLAWERDLGIEGG